MLPGAVLQQAVVGKVYSSCLLSRTCSLPLQAAEVQEAKPGSVSTFKASTSSCLLTFHWPNQATWSSPKSEGQGIPTAHIHKAEGMGIHTIPSWEGSEALETTIQSATSMSKVMTLACLPVFPLSS